MQGVAGRAGRARGAHEIFAACNAVEAHRKSERGGRSSAAEDCAVGIEQLQRDVVALALLDERDLVGARGVRIEREMEYVNISGVMERKAVDLAVILDVGKIIRGLDGVVAAQVIDVRGVADNLHDSVRSTLRVRLVKRHAEAVEIRSAG